MKKIEVNGNQLAYREVGTGETLVFVHAFPLSQKMWDDQVSFFSKNYRVITLDWRGFGESSLALDKIQMSDLADDLAGVVEALALDKFALCGLSMGGYATFAFLRSHPGLFEEKISALILADTKATIENEEGQRKRIEMATLALKSGAGAIADALLPKLIARDAAPQVREKIKSLITGTAPGSIAAAQHGMAARLDATELLSKISCPTLIVVGSEDAMTPPSEAEIMAKKIKTSKLVKIQSSGHLSNLEQPEEFNRVIAEFLQK